ncbi:MAG TPA: ATP-dependent DNA helicase [Acidimicrobiia bacterium]|nr:ATP-dependent DNA helicase [Acidimicrobiia bacterium]
MKIRPTSEQRRILDLGPTSIRIRAGAGTGKTTTVALVIANLVEHHGVEPERILGMTFTNKAAAELAESVARRLPDTLDPSRQVEIHTYHGFAAQVLAEFGPLAGADTRSGVITPTFARQLIRDVFWDRGHQHLDMTNRRTLDQIRKLGDQLGDHLLRPEDLIRAAVIHGDDETWAARVEMAETLARYNEAKAELRVVDYADLVTLSTRVLQQHPALAATVRDRYRVLVLDEYQDTNPAQRVLISTIFGGGFPVIAVGDEDQTIYEWRGASAENFEQFIDHFPTAEGGRAHDEGLTLNRRSGQAILDIANETRRQANPYADELEAAQDIDTEVVTFWAGDALAEAEWIARQFEALHDDGTPWSDMAVLFRKNKDFAILIDVLSRHDIPLEVANVGGLLSVPEISFLRAWLTVLQNPEDSTALAQILFGSSYRLGIADVAPLTRWLTSRSKEHDDVDADETHPVSLIEAIEAAADIEALTPQARQRLARFHTVYRELLLETQGLNLAETCRLVLDHTRAWQDVESLPPNARLSAKLNLYRFLDLADDWSPLSGRPSVAAFLDYLAAMEEEPAEELDSARLSGEDAVTLVTVHRAKGLEWENVAIPAVAKDNFPARSGAFPDPVRFPYHLPIEFRLDTSIGDLPESDEGRRALFRERHRAQEWRVAYVAVSRAKRRLFVTGAYWYGLPEPRSTPAAPSELFELVEANAASRNAGHAEVGPRPPILAAGDTGAAPDPLFPDGWQAALRMARDEPEGLDAVAENLGVADEYRRMTEEWNQRLFTLDDVPVEAGGDSTSVVSVTGLVTYAQCPKRFYWADIDPLPRRRNPAAVRGSEIHRRIELHQRGQVPFDDLEPDLYDVIDEHSRPGAFSVYETSRFATRTAEFVEAPFTFALDNGYKVRGRIDAIYTDGRRWEVVDFKTGRPKKDPNRMVQLEAYAVAIEEVPFADHKPDTLDVTFAYLGGGLAEVTARADQNWVANARGHLESLTAKIEAGVFDPTPGEWCRNCDFLQFCDAGLQEVEK